MAGLAFPFGVSNGTFPGITQTADEQAEQNFLALFETAPTERVMRGDLGVRGWDMVFADMNGFDRVGISREIQEKTQKYCPRIQLGPIGFAAGQLGELVVTIPYRVGQQPAQTLTR